MEKRVVFITGCSTGIGRALADEFHHRGFRVVATARRRKSILDLEAKGMVIHALDVNDPDQVRDVVKIVKNQEKRVDTLVNNAGYGLMGPAIEISPEELELQFRTNLFSVLYLTQQIAPIMKEQKKGMVINIGSVSGITTTPFSGAYCASKAALHALSDALRMELKMFGIDVITVQTGAIKTEFGKAAKAKASAILKKDSWYSAIGDAIIDRAEISQMNATPAEAFASQLVEKVTSPGPPSPILKLGKMCNIVPLIKRIFPTSTLDMILKKKFSLS